MHHIEDTDGKEMRCMMQPIIPIDRAPESWIAGLIEMGILEVTEEGIKCVQQD